MTKREICKNAAAYAGVSIKQANDVINSFLDSVVNAMANGESVSLNNFGTFEMKHRNARTGRNPHTGEAVHIPERSIPSWSPTRSVMDALTR